MEHLLESIPFFQDKVLLTWQNQVNENPIAPHLIIIPFILDKAIGISKA